MIKKILIVDDSPFARKILKSMLSQDKGYELAEAVDGQDAINKHAEFKPDVTFLDLTMPVKDGFTALAEIKQACPEAVVIVLTADIQQKSIARVLELGAFTLLKKPPKAESITDVLCRIDAARTFQKREGHNV